MFKAVRIIKNHVMRTGTLTWLLFSIHNGVDPMLFGVGENVVGR